MSKEDKYEQLRQVCLSYRNEVEELKEKLHKCMPYEDAQEFENFIRNSEKEKYNQQIADLEAKLAESEEYNQMLLEEKGGYIDLVSGYSKKCKNYEQQLAEKEEMIKELSEFILEAKKGTDFLLKQDNKNLREQLAQADQDKISFAVEQLEKVKAFIEYKRRNGSDPYDAHFHCEYLDAMALRYEIDNQIEELKKGNK